MTDAVAEPKSGSDREAVVELAQARDRVIQPDGYVVGSIESVLGICSGRAG